MPSDVKNTDLMSGYEVRIFKGWKKTLADSLKDSKMLEVTLKKALGHDVELELDSGEKVNVPVIDALVLKKLGYDLQHPEKIDLKVYSSVLGETKQEVVVDSETASQVFTGITAKGAKPNGSDTGSPK